MLEITSSSSDSDLTPNIAVLFILLHFLIILRIKQKDGKENRNFLLITEFPAPGETSRQEGDLILIGNEVKPFYPKDGFDLRD